MIEFNIHQAQNFDCSSLESYAKIFLNHKVEQEEIIDGIPLCIRQIYYFKKHPHEYATYAYMSTLFNNIKILELGSKYGLSALAWSYNNKNIVHSYDIQDIGQTKLNKTNIRFFIRNILDTPQNMTPLLDADIIFIDIAPHEGKCEKQIIDFLGNNNYHGITVWHDIHYGSPQKGNELIQFWQDINLTKYDITICCGEAKLGLGIVDFSQSIRIIL